MKLQTVVFAGDCCDASDLYLRVRGQSAVDTDKVFLCEGAELETDTYMNAFDAETWTRYAGRIPWKLELEISGCCEIDLLCLSEGIETLCKQTKVNSGQVEKITMSSGDESGVFYFRIRALTETCLYSAAYSTEEPPGNSLPSLALVICTYHRREFIERNIEKLRNSEFFDPTSALYGKLHITVVDNGSELALMDEPLIRLVHNSNTGGSGGFTRGIREFRARQDKQNFTNIIFMDDDVEFIAESFYRLYALLALVKPEYRDSVIAGRMFRLDQRQMQYTAAEIWNGGDLRHVGLNCDMTAVSVLETMNNNAEAEYGGWWFCCFPMAFAMKNDPMPFFIHCDDVEYGLRHGGTPIILNGIQVWHETYEYRQSPIMLYYDTRNPMIVNAMYCPEKMDTQRVFDDWFSAITKKHVEEDYQSEYLIIRAMWDFLRGRNYLEKTHGGTLHADLTQKKHFTQYENMIFWRLTARRYRQQYHRLIRIYTEWKVDNNG